MGPRTLACDVGISRVKRLESLDGPVLIHFVLQLHTEFVGIGKRISGIEFDVVRELALHATAELHRPVLDAYKFVAPAVNAFRGDLKIAEVLLGATRHYDFVEYISAKPGQPSPSWLPDELRPNCCNFLHVRFNGTANVVLISNFDVHIRLNTVFTFLVACDRGLSHSKRELVSVSFEQDSSITYAHVDLGAANIFALDTELAFEPMLLVLRHLLAHEAEFDLPVLLVKKLTPGLKHHLAVGECHGGDATGMVDRDLGSKGLVRLKTGISRTAGPLSLDRDFLFTRDKKLVKNGATYDVLAGLSLEFEFPVRPLVVILIGVLAIVTDELYVTHKRSNLFVC